MVRLYWLEGVLDSTPIATHTVIFIQIGQLFRKISTDKLFRRHRQTRQAKKQFSSRFSVTSQEICLAQLRIFDGIAIPPFVLRTWKLKKIIKTAVQIFAFSNTLPKFKEARDGPAG